MKEGSCALPPSPPEIPRKLAFYTYQVLGLFFILAIPLLAVLGVFGKTSAEVSETNRSLLMHVSYTSRHRYQMMTHLEITVQNLTDKPISTLILRIDSDYIRPFSTLLFIPSVTRVTATDHEVELMDVAPARAAG